MTLLSRTELRPLEVTLNLLLRDKIARKRKTKSPFLDNQSTFSA
jgi:hypothetical protein